MQNISKEQLFIFKQKYNLLDEENQLEIKELFKQIVEKLDEMIKKV